jgi:Protein of unknown function (DUF2934)
LLLFQNQFFHFYRDEIMAETNSKAAPKKAATKTVAAIAKPAAKKPAVKSTVASAKPAVVKAAVTSAKPATTTKPPAAKAAATKPAARGAKPVTISDESRYQMIVEAAYYRAEKNHFKSDPVRDWIEAENDIAKLLDGGNK